MADYCRLCEKQIRTVDKKTNHIIYPYTNDFGGSYCSKECYIYDISSGWYIKEGYTEKQILKIIKKIIKIDYCK